MKQQEIPHYIDLDLGVNCQWLEQCPICNRCMNAADSIWDRCMHCPFAYTRCKHTDKQRNFAIRRHNFRLTLPKETVEKLRQLGDESCAH